MKLFGFKINKNKNLLLHIVPNIAILLMLVMFSIIIINPNSQYVFNDNNANAIYNGNKNSNKVSLMINVYWGTEHIKPMLEVLKQYNTKCTFFIGGMWAEKEPDMLKLIHNMGHEIANHGYFHKDMNKLNYKQMYDEINTCNKLIYRTINKETSLFAPPSGAFNKTTLEVSNALGHKTIMWSKDTIDWRDKDENLIFSRATKNVLGGDFILMHPTMQTLKALPKILDFYKNNNLFATTVTDNLKI